MNNLAADDLIRQALVEDIGFGDLASEAIFAEDHMSQACLIAKDNLVLAGIKVFTRTFALLDDRVKITSHYQDGANIRAGEKFAEISGPTRSLLAGERVALNFLQHLSGVATETRRYAAVLKNRGPIIVDTRKTLPGLRMLEKYAVTVGGGKNHRYGLDSLVMIKDNHRKAAGGVLPAVQMVRNKLSPFLKIEVEVETLEQVREALQAKADIIMLDNMPLTLIKEAVALIDHQALIEVSGNITLEKLEDLAESGVDIISSGALTHSVKAADISMRL
ncbi:MAG: carboxylating nicotinate-nucleotide diphosphorylase [Pelosinus sp.]|nr:carboxylating nicotinate-nucleotide diphosphorylase [Pelosinus sp.]